MVVRMSELEIGQEGHIEDLLLEGSMRERFGALGFIRGELVSRAFPGIFGDPLAIRVMDAIMVIRKDDAEKILVRV